MKPRILILFLITILALSGCSEAPNATTPAQHTTSPSMYNEDNSNETTSSAEEQETKPSETESQLLFSGELSPEIISLDRLEVFSETRLPSNEIQNICYRYTGSENVVTFSELGVAITLPESLVDKTDILLHYQESTGIWKVCIVNRNVLNAHLEHDKMITPWMDAMLIYQFFRCPESYSDSDFVEYLNESYQTYFAKTDEYYVTYSTREMYETLGGSNDMIFEQIDMISAMGNEAYKALHTLVITQEMARNMISIISIK